MLLIPVFNKNQMIGNPKENNLSRFQERDQVKKAQIPDGLDKKEEDEGVKNT